MVQHIYKLVKFYLRLIKVPQTGLLLFTAVAGFKSAQSNLELSTIIYAGLGLLMVISGTTALNMVFDRDIDFIMERTKQRPIPTQKISYKSALIFGILLIISGLVISYCISLIYSVTVALGMFFDFIIYTLWLKRRSPWSIIFGGLAGGMPILSGRVLATGQIDLIGILLAISILFWIPTHILTLAINHSNDYKLAGVPTFPLKYGFKQSRYFIAFSNIVSAGIFLSIFLLLELTNISILVYIAATLLLLAFTGKILISPKERTFFTLFKYASIYMVVLMIILIIK